MTINLSRIFKNRLVYGLDLNKKVIQFAKKFNVSSNTIFKVDNAFSIEYNKEFSAIFAVEILEHLDPNMHFDFIDGCLSALKPDGLLFLSTPNEPHAVDAKHGHIGFLNSQRWESFQDRYKRELLEVSYIDNTKLLSVSENKIIKGSSDDFCEEDGLNRSHFRIVMGNRN